MPGRKCCHTWGLRVRRISQKDCVWVWVVSDWEKNGILPSWGNTHAMMLRAGPNVIPCAPIQHSGHVPHLLGWHKSLQEQCPKEKEKHEIEKINETGMWTSICTASLSYLAEPPSLLWASLSSSYKWESWTRSGMADGLMAQVSSYGCHCDQESGAFPSFLVKK